MSGNYRTIRRFTILGACLSAFVLLDGVVLLVTGGLSSDATPVFPMLGGSFNATRSSGTSLLIMGVLLAVITFAGWWKLGRRLRDAQRSASSGSAKTPGVMPGSAESAVRDDR